MSEMIENLILACQRALSAANPSAAVRAAMHDALADPDRLAREVNFPGRAGITTLYQAADLTIIDVVWAPGMSVAPHNHNMWAVIGVYAGREDNILWKREAGSDAGKISAAGATSLVRGDVLPLGKDIIHSVLNPIDDFSGAIHVYGGDFFAQSRSQWDALSLTEQPYDMLRTSKAFGQA